MGNTTHSRYPAAAGALAAVVVAATAAAPLLGAGEVTISMERGRVTLMATDALLADVLDEWSRVGETRFVGAEEIGGEPVTLYLVDTPEMEAIHLLLRSAAGYVAAPRRAGASGASRYDRVTILATRDTSVPPRTGAAVPAAVPAQGESVTAGSSPPALVSMEELQRLLDAAAANSASTPPDAEAAPDIPVVMTPFPGIGADPGSSPLPARWRRDRRRR